MRAPFARMIRFIALFLIAFLFAQPALAENCVYRGKDFGATPLKRGINLSGWWEEGRQQAVSPHELGTLYRMGFDFVRLPISQKWLESDEALYDIRCSVTAILNSGLGVVIDLHSSTSTKLRFLGGGAEDVRKGLLQYWQTLATALKGLPPGKVVLGVYNEPEMDMKVWWPLQGGVIATMRKHFPRNRIIASAGHGGWDLVYMQPYPLKNVLYDFHFYEPLQLTHYGAGWFWGRGGQGNQEPIYPNPAEGWNRAHMAKSLIPILGWKNHWNARLISLEIGIYRPHLDAQTRANWLKDARELLEAAHVPWALWEYRGSFGLTNEDGALDEAMAKALGLKHN